MGVPKFFRYMSERYPCLSEIIKEYQIPEFDNLYLDMNGIIHVCSHPDDYDPHFRISEERMISDIFHYIEVLFRMIKPRKLFFMAVDGVAPRAKMNQQRGRRFRSAKEAEVLESKAKERGESLPGESRFDSNCITPGTVFMTRLQDQLKYFVIKKVSTDPLWQRCKIILSGHETPGEGEHKIMDYIRFMKVQPDYDPNTRHCLYGLDADLIMLGLCTHEPHFSLLREEVRFGKKAKRKNIPEYITFYLLHLSLMREYLEQEFLPLKDSLPFEYDMEKIIDDWVLMGFLVGNDFIPHLPNLHIGNGSLPILYKAYMKVLPTFGGYINEAGTLNLERFEKFMSALASLDMEFFVNCPMNSYAKYSLMPSNIIEGFDLSTGRIVDPNDFDSEVSDKASSDTDEIDLMDEGFIMYKKDYYMNKLDYSTVTPEVMRDQSEGYVRAIQWNLNYYYNGVCSWSWFYPHHYAPFISDIKDFSELKLDFELGEPFKPFEQLLAVLPAASKNLLPEPYHELMTSEESPIVEYYPEEFRTDLNGKKQEWEAVVLIPFISEKSLLSAMAPCNEKLNEEEQKRNSHGPMLVFEYCPDDMGSYEAPFHFQTVKSNHAKLQFLTVEDIRVARECLIKGPCPGSKTNVYYPGFPKLSTLPFHSRFEKSKVRVFDSPSTHENMILSLEPHKEIDISVLAAQILGKSVYVGWPHLTEALVTAVLDRDHTHSFPLEPNRFSITNRALFAAEAEASTLRYFERFGIEVGPISILIHVRLLSGTCLTVNHDSTVITKKRWSELQSAFPLQAVVTDLKIWKDEVKSWTCVTEMFPIGSRCFMLGQPHYGCSGVVLENSNLKNGRIKLCMDVPKEPDFMPLIHAHKEACYLPANAAAQRLSISPHLLSRVTGSLLIAGQRESPRHNIGLNLKLNKRNKQIPGYTRKEDNQWLYSPKAIELVRDMLTFCPELFQYLQRNLTVDVYHEEQLFPEGSRLKITDVVDWIKAQPFYKLPQEACGSESVSTEIVKQLEQLVDSFSRDPTKSIVMQVKPHLIYKPGVQSEHLPPDGSAIFELFDRVVNIRDSYTVPLGLRGTVIGLRSISDDKNDFDDNNLLLDVLFDEAFPNGMQINCSDGRAYQVPRAALINISHGMRQMQQKTIGPLIGPSLVAGQNSRINSHSKPNLNPLYNPTLRPQMQMKPPHMSMKSPQMPVPMMNSQPRIIMARPPQLLKEPQQPQFQRWQLPVRAPRPPTHHQPQSQFRPHSQQQSSDGTELLKKMLKIPAAEEQLRQLSVQDLFSHARNVQSQPKMVCQYSLQLLNLCQATVGGCPRYSYSHNGDYKIRAVVILPNGCSMVGRECSTKEEATECVAKMMLDEQSMSLAPMPVPVQAPPKPPSQWCNNAGPFVPLQAVRQQRGKETKSENSSAPVASSSAPSVKNDKPVASGPVSPKKNSQANNKPEKKSERKPRKSRIAAKFPPKSVEK